MPLAVQKPIMFLFVMGGQRGASLKASLISIDLVRAVVCVGTAPRTNVGLFRAVRGAFAHPTNHRPARKRVITTMIASCIAPCAATA